MSLERGPCRLSGGPCRLSGRRGAVRSVLVACFLVVLALALAPCCSMTWTERQRTTRTTRTRTRRTSRTPTGDKDKDDPPDADADQDEHKATAQIPSRAGDEEAAGRAVDQETTQRRPPCLLRPDSSAGPPWSTSRRPDAAAGRHGEPLDSSVSTEWRRRGRHCTCSSDARRPRPPSSTYAMASAPDGGAAVAPAAPAPTAAPSWHAVDSYYDFRPDLITQLYYELLAPSFPDQSGAARLPCRHAAPRASGRGLSDPNRLPLCRVRSARQSWSRWRTLRPAGSTARASRRTS